MRLQEKVYEIKSQDGKTPTAQTIKDLCIVANGVKSEVEFHRLFSSPNFSSGSIKGWSIFEHLKSGCIEINDEKIDIKLHQPGNEVLFEIVKISKPFIQFNDKDIPRDVMQRQIDEIYKIAKSKEESVSSSDESELDRQEQAEVLDKSQPEPQAPAEVEEIYESKEFDEDSKQYIESGYSVERNGNIVKLHKGEKIFVVRINSDSSYETLQKEEYIIERDGSINVINK